jgi:class 3 adenylate cyclase
VEEPAPTTSAERKLVTVLFADVTGSTSLGERLDPEQLRTVLDTFFAAMREEIEAQGGTVEKFIGDAVMAAFGVPTAHEDDAARALRAALHMLDRLQGVNERLSAEHGVELEIRVGVNTGEVLATTEPRPDEGMVTGDAVNVAARLEAAAAPGHIVAAERTVRAVRGFRLDEVGELELKGKSEPLRAFRVLDETVVFPERGVPGLHAPLVGRHDEIELLSSLFVRVERERRPHLVTLYGEAGVGKSRLTREFVESLGDRAALVRGRCLPYGQGVTFWPLAEILKGHAGVLDTDPSDVVLERIRKAGRELFGETITPDPARTTAALAFTVGVEDPSFPFSTMDPKDVRAELHDAWRSFFSALAVPGPVIVLVEDIHWADPALLDLIEEVADRSLGPLMYLCPARPELTANRPNWGGGRRNRTAVTLDALSADDSDRLVGLLLAIDDLPATVRRRILERAEGNPFFLEEIVRHLIDGGMLTHEAGRWRAASGIEDVQIPDTVQGVLAARIDLLDAGDKRVLQAAAVVGRVFWPGSLGGVAVGIDIASVLERLDERELVVSRLESSIAGEREYAFKHVLTRDVAYQSLPKRERADAHASVAAWIERTAGARTREFVELLAHHYATAATGAIGEPDDALRRRAFHYLVAASNESRRKQVLERAEKFGQEALSLARGHLERAIALEAIAEAFFEAYDGDLGWRYFREAAEARAAAAAPGTDPKVAYLCARAAELPTRWVGSMRTYSVPEEVVAVVELGLSHVADGDSEELARLKAVQSSWPFAFPQLSLGPQEAADCERTGIEAAEMALRLGRPDIASGAYDAAAGYAISQGLYDRVLDIERRRLDLVADLGEFELGDLYSMLAWSSDELGRYREGLRYTEEGLRLSAGAGASPEIHLRAWDTVLRYRVGDWDGALDAYEQMRAVLDDRRDDPPYFATHAFVVAGLIHERRGERVESDRLTGLLRLLGEVLSSRLYGWLMQLLIERGEIEEASRIRWDEPPAWRVHASVAFDARCSVIAVAGRWEEAGEAVVEARRFAETTVSPHTLAVADRLEGRAAFAGGDADVAERALRSACRRFAELDAVHQAAVTSLDLAEAVAEEEAIRLCAGAEETFERLRSIRDLERVRALRERLSS